MKKRITIWYILKKTIDFLVPNWLFNGLKKYPCLPLIIVLILYFVNQLLSGEKLNFKLPCVSIFGTQCIQHQQEEIKPFRGAY